jgi:hypothetical protein
MGFRALQDPKVTPHGIDAAITMIEQRATEIAATIRTLRATPVAANDKARAPGAAA